MILNLDEIDGIYMVAGPTDLRKGIDGYSAVVSSHLKLDPFEKNLYLFCNRVKDKMKVLYWDGNGFWLFYKRLESGRFRWPKQSDSSLYLSTEKWSTHQSKSGPLIIII